MLVIQFLLMKHAAFLYDQLREKLELNEEDSNPFYFDNKEHWNAFTNTKSFMNLVDLLLEDTEDCLSSLTKEYHKVDTCIKLMQPHQKVTIDHYIQFVNFDYEDNMWPSLDLLMSQIVSKALDPSLKKIKEKSGRISVLKLECYIKIMQIMNNLGIFELKYFDEEFADVIRDVNTMKNESALVNKIIKLNSWM